MNFFFLFKKNKFLLFKKKIFEINFLKFIFNGKKEKF